MRARVGGWGGCGEGDGRGYSLISNCACVYGGGGGEEGGDWEGDSPHSSNISETAGSTQIQFHIKPLRHLGNKHLLK